MPSDSNWWDGLSDEQLLAADPERMLDGDGFIDLNFLDELARRRLDDFSDNVRAALDADTVARHRAMLMSDVQFDQPEPPVIAEFMLICLLTDKRAENLLGDLAERFEDDLAREISHGRAKWRYWARAFREISPIIKAWLKRLGVIGLLFAAAKRYLSN